MVEGDHLEDINIDGRIILKWTCMKQMEGCGLDYPGPKQGLIKISCKHSKGL